jgi:hypothetical protein
MVIWSLPPFPCLECGTKSSGRSTPGIHYATPAFMPHDINIIPTDFNTQLKGAIWRLQTGITTPNGGFNKCPLPRQTIQITSLIFPMTLSIVIIKDRWIGCWLLVNPLNATATLLRPVIVCFNEQPTNLPPHPSLNQVTTQRVNMLKYVKHSVW